MQLGRDNRRLRTCKNRDGQWASMLSGLTNYCFMISHLVSTVSNSIFIAAKRGRGMSSLLIQKIGKNQARGTKRRKANDGTTVEEEKRPEDEDEEDDDKMIDDLINNGNKPE